MSILLVIATLLTAALYLPAWLSALKGARAATGEPFSSEPSGPGGSGPAPAGALDVPSLLLAGGALAHAFALYLAIGMGPGFHFGFAQALSATFSRSREKDTPQQKRPRWRAFSVNPSAVADDGGLGRN